MKLPVSFSGYYVYGSQLYGTNNETSDIDSVTINYVHSGLEEPQIYSIEEFQEKLDSHEPTAMEGYSLQFHGEKYEDYFEFSHLIKMEIDLGKLRSSHSAVASNSFVKAKKKLLVQDTYDRKSSMKSLFHSIRILDFGKQIAENGYIVDFNSCMDIWEMIKEDYHKSDSEVIELLKTKYKDIHNKYASAFRQVAPKDLICNNL